MACAERYYHTTAWRHIHAVRDGIGEDFVERKRYYYPGVASHIVTEKEKTKKTAALEQGLPA